MRGEGEGEPLQWCTSDSGSEAHPQGVDSADATLRTGGGRISCGAPSEAGHMPAEIPAPAGGVGVTRVLSYDVEVRSLPL